MCGTNMVVRRVALQEVGGMCEENIAEDFLTSLFLQERGWESVYVPEVLAEGLAPEDFLSYVKQQYRWARGSLEVVFRFNPLFRPGMNWQQKLQYLTSASYYLSGVVIAMDALFPLIFFFTGQIPLAISTMSLSAVFLPYILLSLYSLMLLSGFSYTFRALAFSLSSWNIQLQALWGVLIGRKSSFAVTSKTRLSGNFLYLVWPHLFYILLAAVGAVYALFREGATASVMNNIAWALLNSAVFLPFILAAAGPLPVWLGGPTPKPKREAA